MKIKIDLPAEIKNELTNQAKERKISVEEYIANIIVESLELPDGQRNQIIVSIDD